MCLSGEGLCNEIHILRTHQWKDKYQCSQGTRYLFICLLFLIDVNSSDQQGNENCQKTNYLRMVQGPVFISRKIYVDQFYSIFFLQKVGDINIEKKDGYW